MMTHEEVMDLHVLEIEGVADMYDFFLGYPGEEASEEAAEGISDLVEDFDLDEPRELAAGPVAYEI